MKQSHLLVPTLRETPSEADVRSHQLLVRAGYIRQIATGVYAYLPLAQRVMKKITAIIKDELDMIGANEMQMPNILPMDYWQDDACRRLSTSSLFEVSNQNQRQYMLAPSHEKAFIELVKNEVQSYRKLPMKLYQVQMKYRDEKKPKYGLLYSREFLMTDFYSFHAGAVSLQQTFQQVESSIKTILTRCGLTYHLVLGHTNRAGIEKVKEFMALASFGDEQLCLSDQGTYVANLDLAKAKYQGKTSYQPPLPLEKVAQTSDQEITIHSYLYFVDEQPTLIVLRASDQLNLEKVKLFYPEKQVIPASKEQKQLYFDATNGVVTPVHLSPEITVIADTYLQGLANMSCSADEEGYLYLNVNSPRDFHISSYSDFRMVQEGDLMLDGEETLRIEKGLKIGHMMTMSKEYSQALSAQFIDETGQAVPTRICYCSISVSRLLSLIAEQHCDENKIQWPNTVAPFDAHVVPIDYQDSDQQQLADEIVEQMEQAEYEVLLDDRVERAGVKFADADLIGCPIRITIGKKAKEGIVEIKLHQSGDSLEIRKEELVATLAILTHTSE